MIEKNTFVYKLFLSLNISGLSLFLSCKIATPIAITQLLGALKYIDQIDQLGRI